VQPELINKVSRSGGETCVLGIESGNAKSYDYSPPAGRGINRRGFRRIRKGFLVTEGNFFLATALFFLSEKTNQASFFFWEVSIKVYVSKV
jgi:hypothetical protein